MRKPIKIILFSEINSLFGSSFLQDLLLHPLVAIEGLVTSVDGQLCSYYLNESVQVNLKDEALKLNIPVFQPQKINEEVIQGILKSLDADYFLIANYQKILKQRTIDIPKVATINFHPSLLPAYAGLAPFFWMAKQGETHSGVSAIRVNETIDAGELVAQIPISLQGVETASEIREMHFNKSIELLRILLPQMIEKKLNFQAQDLSKRSYFSRPNDHDFIIDWNSSNQDIMRIIRAAYRYPGAVFVTEKFEKIVILSAESIQSYGDSQLNVCALGSIHFVNNRWLLRTREGFIHIKTIGIGTQEIALNEQTSLFGKELFSKEQLLVG